MPLDPPVDRSPAPTRRALLRGGAATAGGAAVLAGAGRAEAAFTPAHYRGEPLLGSADRHLVTRFSYGITPGLTRQVRAAGGARTWFEQQLVPSRVPDPAAGALQSWWPSLARTPQDLWQRQIDDVEGGWEVMADYQRWLLMRRITTNRQLHEVLTEFWMNHLNVPVHGDGVFTYRFSYDRAVRAHALGRYADLLRAAIVHPAMGIYLNNAVSTKRRPNENLGRELLELHTVGRGDHYTEDDVKSSARILTGYLVDMWDTWESAYEPAQHWTGPVRVMGFRHDNGAADGRAVVEAYLAYLARHPLTAQRIARKLAVKFIGDAPSDSLVRYLAQVYLDHDTAIAPVLRALIRTKAFLAASGQKVRDPAEDVVATYRALGVKVRAPRATDDGAAAEAILWQANSIGAVPHDWPRPDGQPIDNESWSSPARLLASFEVHWVMSGGWWPRVGITYRTPRDWLPFKRVRFDLLVDSLSQRMLGRRSTSTLLKACCEAVEVWPSTRIDAEHPVVRWQFHALLSTILDSPTHLSR